MDKMDLEILFPWPFAGYSREGDNTVYWDEILMVGKLDMSLIEPSTARETEELYGINRDILKANSCPMFVLLKRGGTIEDKSTPYAFQSSDDFSTWFGFALFYQ